MIFFRRMPLIPLLLSLIGWKRKKKKLVLSIWTMTANSHVREEGVKLVYIYIEELLSFIKFWPPQTHMIHLGLDYPNRRNLSIAFFNFNIVLQTVNHLFSYPSLYLLTKFEKQDDTFFFKWVMEPIQYTKFAKLLLSFHGSILFM